MANLPLGPCGAAGSGRRPKREVWKAPDVTWSTVTKTTEISWTAGVELWRPVLSRRGMALTAREAKWKWTSNGIVLFIAAVLYF